MSGLRSLIDDEAPLGSESDDGDFDEDAGEDGTQGKRRTKPELDDSSEEESDDDEEAARAVREGFIVEEDEEEDEEGKKSRRKERRKRRREEREEAGLDDEDLDLIGEANPDLARHVQTEPKLKRLKRGHKEEHDSRTPRGPGDLFDSDEEDEARDYLDTRRGRPAEDEFADFIEQDYSDAGGEEERDDEVSRNIHRGNFGVLRETAGLDEDALADFNEAFGDGTEYDWALELQERDDNDRRYDPDDPDAMHKAIELKDVFEPSQLAEKMLTDADNLIRATDEPERFQLARAPYKDLVLTEEQIKEEPVWISNLLLPKKRLGPHLREPFQKSVAKVLEFMNTDEFEVPFIFQHRKDYLIHAAKVATSPGMDNGAAPEYVLNAEKLLNQSDLWDIFDLDLKYRALIEKRNALQRTFDNLKSSSNFSDPIFEEMLPLAVTMEELQDVQDYLYFQHSSRLSDLAAINGRSTNGTHKRPGATRVLFEKIRASKVYNLVKAFGITADDFAQNALRREGRRQYTEDPADKPEVMAESEDVLDPPEYSSGAQCLRAARAMFAEEIFVSPKMRKVMRQKYYSNGTVECFRTEKGLRKIDEQHPYYEFKYLRNQQLIDIAERPGMFLRMLRAEEEGLVEVRIRLHDFEDFKKTLYGDLESDNFSAVAESWNKLRREALDMALLKLNQLMAKGVKENLKAECEGHVSGECREKFSARLDQAPYKPKGMMLGTIPRVLAMSNGNGMIGKDPIYWAWVEEDGRVLENGKLVDLSLAETNRSGNPGVDLKSFIELVSRRRPDVIAVSGFSVETRKLVDLLEQIVKTNNLHGADYDDEAGNSVNAPLDVVIVNDEIARLYQNSDRANLDYPTLPPLTKYCVALAKYLQNPLKEYASLGKDLISVQFDPDQTYVAQDKIQKALDTAMVDMVNLCGVDINDAVSDPYSAALLPYICGLGPRKAQQLLKVVNINGGVVTTRSELVVAAQHKLPAVGPRVWANCASFLWIEFDASEPESDYLDNTRVHPEDYDLGRKMAADALELDEEDIVAETQENGAGAIVRKLIKDDAQEKVDDLVLEEYAEQLEKNFNQRKRATLETIRAELQVPYEELRRDFGSKGGGLSTNEIFTMFSGETPESLCEGMIVPVSIKRVMDDSIEGKLDCGIDGVVTANHISDNPGVSAKQLFSSRQTIQAKILHIDRKSFRAELSLLDEELRRPYKKDMEFIFGNGGWDSKQEAQDKEELQEKNIVSGRTQRVIKHPLFRPFSAIQAEEYLGSQARGEVVIRPSSKGPDHLCVTWKFADGVYQHIDVLELDKENEFSVGKTLKIGGKYTYSDLDELVVNHIKAMTRKVDEMMLHEKFKAGTRTETEGWLTTYTEANPKRSVYAFCINPKHPGYFFLCFKAGQNAQLQAWNVKVIPNAYELQKIQYQDMRALCNGFKMIFQSMVQQRRH